MSTTTVPYIDTIDDPTGVAVGMLAREGEPIERHASIPAYATGRNAPLFLDGDLFIPPHATGLVLFAHGTGSSRRSARNRYVASILHQQSMATLLFDLLSPHEEALDAKTGELRFDIALLARRLAAAVDWAAEDAAVSHLPLGVFGASTGAAAALLAAAHRVSVRAVVSRGGRPELAGRALAQITCPVMLIVGERDSALLELNRRALASLHWTRELVVVPKATHLFPEEGALTAVAQAASRWFAEHLPT